MALCALCTLAASAGDAFAQRRVEGALAHHWPGAPAPTPYRYVIRPDSGGAVTIYEGEGAGAPAVTLPPLVVRALAQRLDRHATDDRAGRTHAEVGLERGGVRLALDRRIGFAFIGGGAALVLSLGLVAALALRVRRARARVATLDEARRRQVESREAERLRLAREIHDGPVQLLHLVRLNLAAVEPTGGDGASGTVGSGPPVAGARADIHEAIRELRSIAEGLRPPALGPFGLAYALRDLAARFREQHPGVALDLALDDDGDLLPESARLALFRVAQEGLSNAAAHADPSRVALRFLMGQRGVELAVEDDGRGAALPIDPGELARGGHFGLLGMRERAELLGGELDVRAAPDLGTAVLLRVPWAVLHPQSPLLGPPARGRGLGLARQEAGRSHPAPL